MFKRTIKPPKSNSFFLFGARGTGKSTLLKHHFSAQKAYLVNLLLPEEEDRFARNPSEFAESVKKRAPQVVIIDEVQKVPKLLNVVQSLMLDHPKIQFALTGSSARKLKRGGANLLAGRAFLNYLYPLTSAELGEVFSLQNALAFGTLPAVWNFQTAEEKKSFLHSYAITYFKEEIQAEQIVRKLEPFRNFLEVAAQSNGKIISYANIARDVSVDIKTVQSYFQILEDTLIGFLLEPFHRSLRKRQRQGPKFYFIDTGLARALARTLTLELAPQTSVFGNLFEQFVILEIYKRNHYFMKDYRFSYLRTKDDAEIDLIIERPGLPLALIEIKSSPRIDESHLRTLARFRQDLGNCDAYCLSQDPLARIVQGIHVLPWTKGLEELGLV
ncbi:MAG: ATPase [Deltaproteobacteria bacterium CG11_big_fil_rev_8_21_14_0_20_42_23]|nr:MAG: ATPase [Deltaproteobacteria bacterium CG11_big_fil_rev_8_21_14_0_20_42_23]PJC64970.1 MAG: ATPase [Deltaproteobacteria bacterium CG_4_9_14_0_2_um_filter_42_21]